MASPFRPLGLALLGLASILPTTVGAQPPVYLTQWGTPGGGDGQFQAPYGVAADPSGNVYVADYGNLRIQKFADTGAYLAQWGSRGSGDGQFLDPFGVATDAQGRLYVADYGNHRLQKFDGSGISITPWGSLGSGNGQFLGPIGVATDAGVEVYVGDNGNHRIQKFRPVMSPASRSTWGRLKHLYH